MDVNGSEQGRQKRNPSIAYPLDQPAVHLSPPSSFFRFLFLPFQPLMLLLLLLLLFSRPLLYLFHSAVWTHIVISMDVRRRPIVNLIILVTSDKRCRQNVIPTRSLTRSVTLGLEFQVARRTREPDPAAIPPFSPSSSFLLFGFSPRSQFSPAFRLPLPLSLSLSLSLSLCKARFDKST